MKFYFKYIYKTITLLFIFTITTSCTKENLVDRVKNSVLNIDRTISIGKALDSYNFFDEKKYEEFTDDKGRNIVRFTGVLNTSFRSYILQCVADAKIAAPEPGTVMHAIKIVDLAWKNLHAGEICEKQLKFNITELNRIIKRADDIEDCQVNFVIDFSKSVDTNEILIVKKNIIISNWTDGKFTTIEPECNVEIVSEKVLKGIFKNEDPFDNTKECLIKYNIKPCSLEE